MNARDELAKLLFITDNHSPDAEQDWLHLKPYGPKYLRGYYDEADAVFAAGYSKPRTITTAEELDALPVGTVVLSDVYRYQAHGGADCGWPVSFQRWKGGDWHRGGRSSSTHPDNFLPVTVLHDPEATA